MKPWKLVGAASLLVVASFLLFILENNMHQDKTKMNELRIQVPFIFSDEINPRAVYTVGDQIISEHIFALHGSSSFKKSYFPLFSNVEIDRKINIVRIQLKRDVYLSNGEKLSYDEFCNSVKLSFSNTQHTRYKNLVKKIECIDNTVQISMSAIPVNLEYWLRSTDFAISKNQNIPITKERLNETTGPYKLMSLTSSSAKLKRNHHYPQELTSNTIENVTIQSYDSSKVQKLIKDKRNFDIAYFYGYSVSQNDLNNLKDLNYKIQVFPSEWIIYLCFQKFVSRNDRLIVSNKIDFWRRELAKELNFGREAFSIIPGDSPFGLQKEEYLKISNEENNLEEKLLSRNFTIATLKEWAEIPLFAVILSKLEKELNINIKLFPRDEMKKIYSKSEADMYLSPMGVSPADPLGNLSFFLRYDEVFQEVLSEDSLMQLYKESDMKDFSLKIKEIEKSLIRTRGIIPIAHFPGIVVESNRVVRDEVKSWDWGIQAWTYEVN